jgi:hypothetical protein
VTTDGEIQRIRALSTGELQALSVKALGMDADLLDLGAPETRAALVRRAASYLTPCPAQAVRKAVLQALDGLGAVESDERDDLRLSIEEMIEALTIYGDLLELPADDTGENSAARILYLAPPTFVQIDDVLFVIGGALDGVDAIPPDLRAAIDYRSHTRRILDDDTTELVKRLRAIGWVELRKELWLPPAIRSKPEELVARANVALAAKPTVGEVPGLMVLDSDTPNTFYPARWAVPIRKSGRFVARREQRYGADLWSYVEVVSGVVTHLVDLPLDMRTAERPCDAAWQLQMAIDSLAQRPQVYRRRSAAPPGSVLVDFFSPVPLWARRRWDVFGEEIVRSGSLFSYRFPIEVFADVERTLQAELWLRERL